MVFSFGFQHTAKSENRNFPSAMTQGRFDTTHNCRPNKWDDRLHWTNHHHAYSCEKDHQERESCPFHDLRAGGQFQYEYCGTGVGGTLVEPHTLNKRSDARHMVHGMGKGSGIGGFGSIPCDTDPGGPQSKLSRPLGNTNWGGSSRLKNGLFSSPEYIPEGERDGKKKALPPVAPGGPLPPFSAGSKHVPFTKGAIPHSAGPYQKGLDPGRNFHFKCGVAKPLDDSRTKHMPCPDSDADRSPRDPTRPFYVGKAPGDPFNGPLEHLPEPYSEAKIKNSKRPLFTWATKSKFSMPTHVSWSTGKQTAMPQAGATLGLTSADAPSVENKRFTHTVGKEAAKLNTSATALSADTTGRTAALTSHFMHHHIPHPPEPVRFR